jgi:hypothetical protein
MNSRCPGLATPSAAAARWLVFRPIVRPPPSVALRCLRRMALSTAHPMLIFPCRRPVSIAIPLRLRQQGFYRGNANYDSTL